MTTVGRWREAANRLWPDAADMAWDGPQGNGRWAVVAWCAGVTVRLHATRDLAAGSMSIVNYAGCGHGCWGDHEVVDMAAPPPPNPWIEAMRLMARRRHLADCRTCRHVFDGRGPDAAAARHLTPEVEDVLDGLDASPDDGPIVLSGRRP